MSNIRLENSFSVKAANLPVSFKIHEIFVLSNMDFQHLFLMHQMNCIHEKKIVKISCEEIFYLLHVLCIFDARSKTSDP